MGMAESNDFTPCVVTGCTRSTRARDYCSMHYSRQLRTGDPLGRSGSPKARTENFKMLGKLRCHVCNGLLKEHKLYQCYARSDRR